MITENEILTEIDQWYEAIPMKWRSHPPRDLQERIAYDEWMIEHVKAANRFSFEQKQRLIHALSKDLEKTEIKQRNSHECACCGITLHISAEIGPECRKHPDKYPCNAHRKSQKPARHVICG
jgi:hypothetical protein